MARRPSITFDQDELTAEVSHDGLTAAQIEFCYWFADTRNLALAYRMAYATTHRESGHLIHTLAVELYSDSRIRARINSMRAEREMQLTITKKEIFDTWAAIASADVTQIVSLTRVNCRYCNGFGYAWKNEIEFVEACESEARVLDCAGGFSFDALAAPAPGCWRCNGRGEPNYHVTDHSRLGPNERRLIRGYKVAANGEIEVQLHDQTAANDKMAQALGMLKNDVSVSVMPSAPREKRIMSEDLTDAEATSLYLEAIKG